MSRFVFLAVVCLAFAACGDSTSPESVAGRYSLVSVNGDPVPFVIVQVEVDRFELSAGHIQLNADGTCSFALIYQTTEDGVPTTDTESDTCTWTLNNTTIAFTFPDGRTNAGSLIDGRISINTSDAFALVYRK